MTPNKKYSRNVRFIWADKTALVVVLVLSAFLVCAWLLTFVLVGSSGTHHLWKDIAAGALKLDLLIAGVVWAALRGIDFIGGGSIYRLFVRHHARRSVVRKDGPAPYDRPIAYDRKIPRFETDASFQPAGK